MKTETSHSASILLLSIPLRDSVSQPFNLTRSLQPSFLSFPNTLWTTKFALASFSPELRLDSHVVPSAFVLDVFFPLSSFDAFIGTVMDFFLDFFCASYHAIPLLLSSHLHCWFFIVVIHVLTSHLHGWSSQVYEFVLHFLLIQIPCTI